MENNEINNSTDRRGQTITFYSYKGGVGRSMALVNIACLAAKEKKKILLIDCDLEAPGLHQFFETDKNAPGFVELIESVAEWVENEEHNNEEGYCHFMAEKAGAFISKNVNPIAPAGKTLTAAPNEALSTVTEYETSISVDLIKSGRFDGNYSKKLGALNWVDLYNKAPAFFRTFAYCLEKDYDYIFVDARTGLADTSGICTMLMPQKLVLVFALNNQNINGVVDVAGQAIDYRFTSHDFRELQIYPLPSRIENSVNPHLQQWIDNYKEKFVQLFTEKYLLDECRLSPYFDRSFIQYYPIHAYGENIPSLYESVTSSNFITYNYNNFYTVLKKNIPAWEVLSTEEEQAKINQANEYFQKGLECYYKNDYKQAVEEYTRAITANPDLANAYFNRALSYHAEKKYTEAMADYNLVIEKEPNAADAYHSIGTLKNEMGLHAEAIVEFDKAIAIKPDYASSYNNRAISKEYLNNYDEALKDYNRAIELNPEYPSAYNNRGVVKEKLNLFEEALEDFNKAIAQQPGYAKAYFNSGHTKEKMKRYADAIMDYDKAIEFKPDDAGAYNNRGVNKYFLKRYEESLQDYSKAIELKPDYELAYNNSGLAKESLKQFAGAVEDYNRAIEIRPGYSLAYFNRAISKQYLKLYDEAVADLDKCIELNPEHSDAFNERGNTKYAQKKYGEAITDYNKALALDPGNSILFRNKGLAYYQLKQYDEAALLYNEALRLNPAYVAAYTDRADLMYDKRDFEAALKDYKKAAELLPDDLTALNGLANTYRRLNDLENALKFNTRSLEVDPELYVLHGTRAEIFAAMNDDDSFYISLDKSLAAGLDLNEEINQESEIMTKYLQQPRFQELLKKYNIQLSNKPGT